MQAEEIRRTEAIHDDAQHAVETAARSSYGRLVAYLAARTGDVAAAEDALGDAFLAALTHWSTDGVPQKPDAWLLTTARRKLLDGARHLQVAGKVAPALWRASQQTQEQLARAEQQAALEMDFPDERIKMLFTCAHPAIDESIRTPLLLQTVLGLNAGVIGSAFLVAPATMGQRLARAKTKIRAAGIRFEVPEARELPARVGAVLSAIYAAYGVGWDNVAGADVRRKELAGEAISLGRVAVQTLPEEPEAKGLLALMLYCEARRAARRSASGDFVPLDAQDTMLWSRERIGEAESLLGQAAEQGRPGRFQLEAAIQSAHTQRAFDGSGKTNWEAVAHLYDILLRLAPAVGAFVSAAAAHAEAFGAATGLSRLEELPTATVSEYQPYWTLRAHLLRRLERHAEARQAFVRAIGLCTDSATRDYLCRQVKVQAEPEMRGWRVQ